MKQKAVQKWSCSLYRAQRNYEGKLYVGNPILFIIPAFVPFNTMVVPLLLITLVNDLLSFSGCTFSQEGKKDLENPLWAKTMKYFNVVTWVWACWVFCGVRCLTQKSILSGIKRHVDFGGDEEKVGQHLKGEPRCNGRGILSVSDSEFCYHKV